MTTEKSLIKTELDKVLRRFEKIERDTDWKKCPACLEEWTKLHPCKIMGSFTYVCIECAESVKSFPWIVKTYPLEKPFVNYPDDWILVELFFPPKMTRMLRQFCRNQRAKISIVGGKSPDATWELRADSSGLFLYQGETYLEKFENALQAWFILREKIKERVSDEKKDNDPLFPSSFKRVR